MDIKMKKIKTVLFHGGCRGCSQQEKTNSYDTCKGCCYLDANWYMPSMNNEALSEADILRLKLLAEPTTPLLTLI